MQYTVNYMDKSDGLTSVRTLSADSLDHLFVVAEEYRQNFICPDDMELYTVEDDQGVQVYSSPSYGGV